MKNYCHQKKIRQIDSLLKSLDSTFYVKTLLSRNFCQRSATVNFRNYHTVNCDVDICTVYNL